MVADEKLLLMATNVLSQWTLERVTDRLPPDGRRGIKYLAQLDRIGIIELRPLNRYRLKLAKTFRWRPHGPVMHYFRDNALLDYFAGGFDGPGEGVLLVHGSISRALAPAFRNACSAWRKTLRNSTWPTRSCLCRSARATPCCWPCAAGIRGLCQHAPHGGVGTG